MDGAQGVAASAAASGAVQPQIDDWGALLLHHQAKVRSLQPASEKAAAAAKAARDEVNNAIERGATDLGVTNEKFREWLAKGKADIADITQERELDERAMKTMGKLVQADLFSQKDTAGLQAVWHHRGYDDGVNGRDQRDGIDPIYLQDYMQGWTAGQAVLGLGLARGKVLVEQQGQPQTSAPVNLNTADGDEDEDEDDEDKIADAAAKLRRDPEFMARGPAAEPDDEDEDDDHEDAKAPAAAPSADEPPALAAGPAGKKVH